MIEEVYHEPKRELEQVLCSLLGEHTNVQFFPNKGDLEMETPFGAVVCEEATPLIGGRKPRAYLCNVKVVYVSHMDEVDAQEHGANVAQTEDALSLIPQVENTKFSRYLPRHELYGYTIDESLVKDKLGDLRVLLDNDDHLYTRDDPDLFAKEMREALYNIKESPRMSQKYDELRALTAHYTFTVQGGKVLAKYHKDVMNDRYILSRRHIQIAGLHINNLTTNSESQSFADIFDCRVGIQEVC